MGSLCVYESQRLVAPPSSAIGNGAGRCSEADVRVWTTTERRRYQVLRALRRLASAGRARAHPRATQRSGQREHGVEVELRDRGQVLAEAREPVHELVERARRRPPARRGSLRRACRPSPPSTSSSASTSVSGAIRNAASPISSANTPPGPNATSGPKTGSWTTPASSSAPPCEHRLDERRAAPIRSTACPHRRLVGEVERDALRSPSCARPATAVLTTHGKPSSRAAATASSADSATRSGTSGTP